MGTEEQVLENDSNVDLSDIETSDHSAATAGPLQVGSTTLPSSLNDIRSLTALEHF